MWICCSSGLMSRCYTIAHAYHMIKTMNKKEKLKIIWLLEENVCNIKYEDVFEETQFSDIEVNVYNIKQVFSVEKRTLDLFRKKNYVEGIKTGFKVIYNILNCAILKILSQKCEVFNFGEIFNVCSVDNKDEWNSWNKKLWNEIEEIYEKREVFIYAYNGIIHDNIIEKELEIGKIIQFKEKYLNKVESIMKNEGRYIGVHIRRTDHNRVKEKSPTQLYINKMDELVEEDPCLKFFIATDDVNEEKYIRGLFGEKIVVNEDKKFGRNSKVEMEDGIIDCLSLAKCEYILGSQYSVFSKFAAEYGKKELINIEIK